MVGKVQKKLSPQGEGEENRAQRPSVGLRCEPVTYGVLDESSQLHATEVD